MDSTDVPRTRDAIKADAMQTIRALLTVGDNREQRTALLKYLAGTLVELREHFVTTDGHPDWAGKTYAYRMAIHDLYSEAGAGREDAATLMSVVRYHVGNVMRTRLNAEDLTDFGLQADSPLDRSRVRSRDRAALLRALAEPDSVDDPVVLMQIAEVVLRGISLEAVAALTPEQRHTVRQSLRRASAALDHVA